MPLTTASAPWPYAMRQARGEAWPAPSCAPGCSGPASSFLPREAGREGGREREIAKGKIKEERKYAGVALIVAGVFLYHVWSKLILAGIGQWYNRSRVQKHG
ncbi:hypothetical protein PAHAL_6G142000 [Panicum hallii]|uniref:Uncharacterized protein n=1 Tax=Panicum hallii TaxID=206008 RepID=A0A2T8IG65_9POAL|nr:hypothetical protein PAHAL_6G142000 [Panicum hallii]